MWLCTNLPWFHFFISKIFFIFAVFHAEGWSVKDASKGWDDIHKKAFAKRFDFDILRISQIQSIGQGIKATVNVPWDGYI